MAGALSAVGGGSAASILTSCGGNGGSAESAVKPLREPGSYYIPELPDMAADGKELKAGVIGCGGRGSGAAFNFLAAANGVTITALGDTFQERIGCLQAGHRQRRGRGHRGDSPVFPSRAFQICGREEQALFLRETYLRGCCRVSYHHGDGKAGGGQELVRRDGHAASSPAQLRRVV